MILGAAKVINVPFNVMTAVIQRASGCKELSANTVKSLRGSKGEGERGEEYGHHQSMIMQRTRHVQPSAQSQVTLKMGDGVAVKIKSRKTSHGMSVKRQFWKTTSKLWKAGAV